MSVQYIGQWFIYPESLLNTITLRFQTERPAEGRAPIPVEVERRQLQFSHGSM
ncbi:MAG: hypothetical protein WC277_12095 [Bacilli bacterium]